MTQIGRPRKWTKETCVAEAAQYQYRADFNRGSPGAYAAARLAGWLEDCCAHMTQTRKPDGYWTRDRCAAEAAQYRIRWDFQQGSKAAYLAARRGGWLDDICTHMVPGWRRTK